MPDPHYEGRSPAIHVESDTVASSPIVADPVNQAPVILGRSPMLRVTPEAPTWDLNESAQGPVFEGPHYRGRSKAIHVRGPRVVVVPPPPVHSCRCCAEHVGCDCGITDSFTRTQSASLGVSDSTLRWMTPTIARGYPIDGGSLAFSVNGTAAVIDATNSDVNGYASQVLEGSIALPATILMHFTAVNVPLPKVLAWGFNIFPDNNLFSFNGAFLELFTNPNNSGSGSADLGIQVNMNPGATAGDAIQPGAAGSLTAFSGQPFTVKMEITTTSVSAKYWYDSGTEPVGYQVTIAGSLPAVLTRLNWFYNGDQGSVGSVTLADIDVTGVNLCTETRFDNFNRVVANGWGASDEGLVWVDGPSAGTTVSVNGSQGVATVPYLGNATQSVDGPAAFFNATWAMTARITLPSVLPVHSTEVRFNAWGANGNAAAGFNIQSGNQYVFVEGVATTVSFSAGATYLCKWEVTWAGAVNINVWNASVAEPAGWQASSTTSITVPPSPAQAPYFAEFNVRLPWDNNFGGGSGTWAVDYVDFDYAGRSCPPCGTYDKRIWYDGFSRTTSSGGSFGSGFGNAEPGGVWEQFAQGDNGGSSMSAYCDGTYARIDLKFDLIAGNGPSSSIRGSKVQLTSGFAGFENDHFLMESKVYLRPGLLATSSIPKATLWFNDAFSQKALEIVYYCNLAYPAMVGGSTTGIYVSPEEDVAAFVGAADFSGGDGWYFVEWEFQKATLARGRVWREGTAKPGWQREHTVSATPDNITTFAAHAFDYTPSFGGGHASEAFDIQAFIYRDHVVAFDRLGTLPATAPFVQVDYLRFTPLGCDSVGALTSATGDCANDVGGCVECDDPDNPGFQIPDFTPGYLPTFRRQIGDPTTSLDSFICTLESAAMVLAWHTRGAVDVWGGQLIPWCGKTEAQIAASGSNLGNARQAWSHYGQTLSVRSGQTWTSLMAALAEGRAVILQGDYGVFSNAVKCQDSFEGFHAISVYPYETGGYILVGDPLCSTFHGVKEADLRAYAEALGVVEFGVTSPQKILFAVSRAWVGI